MEKRRAGVSVLVGCAMLVAGGCAKHQMVRTDESVAPPVAAVRPPVKAEPVKAEPVTGEKVKEAPIGESAMQNMNEPDANGRKLQAALERVYFNFDSFTLSGEARSTLVRDANLLKKYSAANVRIAGNCDERGSDEYNLALGERRAKSAMQYLSSLGIPSSRLTVVSYGKEKPAVNGHDEAAWAKNRRDDFAVVSK